MPVIESCTMSKWLKLFAVYQRQNETRALVRVTHGTT